MAPPNPPGQSPAAKARKRRKFWRTAFTTLAWLTVLGILAGIVLVIGVVTYYSSQLPDFRNLTEYKPALITKVYDRHGDIIAEFARERRIWIPVAEMPKGLIEAYLAAEDADFYKHGGYDVKAIARAAIMNALTDRKQGASTITQQVAKTFLLTSERTYTRKIKELILSWRIEKMYSKDEILELYLNRIYLGNGSYGVGAAAQTYFGKTLAELTVPEMALLAGLPQAPTRYNPLRNPSAAVARRNIILGRMVEEKFIEKSQAEEFKQLPVGTNPKPLKRGDDAPHFSEYVRRLIEQQYGAEALYDDGLVVYTTLDLDIQKQAETAVYEGLRSYDRRHGWRGPLKKLESMSNWADQLQTIAEQYAYSTRIGEPAVVLSVSGDKATVGLYDERKVTVPASSAKWTGRSLKSLLKAGDVVMVKQADKDGKVYNLEQLPAVQGALVALDVRTGEVLAMVGGLGEGVGFNRAIQAKRQVGSSFKPFVYAAAMEKGYTPASTVLDAPLVFEFAGREWAPKNYDGSIGGLTPLRVGLEKSKNLMTVRLAQDVSLRPIADLAKRMGISDKIPTTDLTVALGSVNLSLLDMVSAYSVFPRGGLFVPPSFISRIQDSRGATLYRGHPACEGCMANLGGSPDKLPTPPAIPATQALSPQHAYQMTSILQGVVRRGTGASAASLGMPLGGKTGTTNDYIDAWFVGFSPSLAVGVWVGFDNPKSLGHAETGGRAALPIWKQFVSKVLGDKPAEDFPVPDGIEFVRVDAQSGLLPGPGTEKTVTEAFVPGTAPTETTPLFYDDGSGSYNYDPNANVVGDDEAPSQQRERPSFFNPFGIF